MEQLKNESETELQNQSEIEMQNQSEAEMRDEKYMKEALKQAKKAYALEETPIGCVIVHEGKIIARGYNRRNTDKSPLAHAEISAIKKASKKLGDWRLEECTLYVTLEPCQMCCRCDHPVPDSKSGGGLHESKGRLCRIGAESFGCAGIQSPG